ncbi:hypothetical protein, partial [Escherichia coli]|uniref:hypothetical protein n=1 Tax=Escherichia coli TaxID=562 RepID=UPI001CDA61FC
RDLILQLSKSSIYSTKPMLMQSEHFRRYAFLLCPQYQVSRMESSRSPFLTPDIPPNLFCTAYIMLNN